MHGSAYMTVLLNTRGNPLITYGGTEAEKMFRVSAGLNTVITLLDGTRIQATVFRQFMNLHVRLPGIYAARTTGRSWMVLE